MCWLGLVSEQILGKLHVELDIFTLKVLASWHSELELLVNVEVDIILIFFLSSFEV